MRLPYFAREGAKVFLAVRTLGKLDQVAKEISAAGGTAETAEVDALDEKAIDQHADAVAAKVGGIDIALNAVGSLHGQGTPFAELSFQDYAHPITALHANELPHGEGRGEAHDQAGLGGDPHIVHAGQRRI